jgi:hypothetical protein
MGSGHALDPDIKLLATFDDKKKLNEFIAANFDA